MLIFLTILDLIQKKLDISFAEKSLSSALEPVLPQKYHYRKSKFYLNLFG